MTTDPRSFLATVLKSHIELVKRVDDQLTPDILAAAELLETSIHSGGKVLLCGNGGSAADAQHFAAELVGRFGRQGDALAAIALTVDTSVLTAVGNDQGFPEVFSRQVEALGKPGDLLIVISTSGRSSNVLRAAEQAHSQGIQVIALTGADGESPLSQAEVTICIPSRDTQRIQEMHSIVLHVIGELLVNES